MIIGTCENGMKCVYDLPEASGRNYIISPNY